MSLPSFDQNEMKSKFAEVITSDGDYKKQTRGTMTQNHCDTLLLWMMRSDCIVRKGDNEKHNH